MSNVLVVPELEDWSNSLLQGENIFINENLGRPAIEERDVRYVVPYWLDTNRVHRIYHIQSMDSEPPSFVISLGNSYIINNNWNNIGQRRRFEYHSLASFGFREVQPGFLLPL